jgi:hypothetical protein
LRFEQRYWWLWLGGAAASGLIVIIGLAMTATPLGRRKVEANPA